MSPKRMDIDLRKVVALVAALNLAYFGIEFVVALAIGSVSLFADSVDFLEDTSLNLLILLALGWSAHRRAQVGTLLAGILLIPGLATLWAVWQKFLTPVPPSPLALSFTGVGAMLVNLVCALMLARFSTHGSSLTAPHCCRRETTCWPMLRSSELDWSPPSPFPSGLTL